MRNILLLSSSSLLVITVAISFVGCQTHPSNDLPLDNEIENNTAINIDASVDASENTSKDGAINVGSYYIKNINEFNIDASFVVAKPKCGDVNMPKCELGEKCRTHEDCVSEACDDRHICIADKSCVNFFGGRTCGVGEVDSPNANHESCCATDVLPTSVKYDRYKVTAGRMRAFIERVNGDVYGWYQNNRNKLSPTVIEQIDPMVSYLPHSNTLGELHSIPEQLGSYIYLLDKPSKLQGCLTKGTGTHTYWLSPEENAFYGDIPHAFSKEVLDTKPLNCITLPLAMAFCAWDGRRLQTYSEYVMSYGATRFPWGTLPEPGGYGNINGMWQIIGAADKGFGVKAGACPTCDVSFINWSYNYEFPERNVNVPSDYSYWISAPGRFAKDVGPYGAKDIAGDLIELTSTNANYIDDHGRVTYKWTWNASFEGHDLHHMGYAFAIETKYAKTGFRCVSD